MSDTLHVYVTIYDADHRQVWLAIFIRGLNAGKLILDVDAMPEFLSRLQTTGLTWRATSEPPDWSLPYIEKAKAE